MAKGTKEVLSTEEDALKAEIAGKDELIEALQEELKDAGKVAKAPGEVGKLGKKKYVVKGPCNIAGTRHSAKEVADSPELLQTLVDIKSGIIEELA